MALRPVTARTIALVFPLLAAVCLALGCTARSDGPEKGGTASNRQSLVGPFIITLSSPSPLAPIAPVLLESNSVFLGAAANIVSGTVVAMGSGGGGVHAEPDGLLNDTWSRGTADLRDRVHVRGTLHASSATLGNSVSVGARDTTPPFDPPQTLSWTVTYPSGTGVNITLNSGQSRALAPGLYGSIVLNSQSTLTLSSGTYFLTDLVINSQVTVNLDQSNGPVIIYVTNTLNLRGAFVPLGGSSDGGAVDSSPLGGVSSAGGHPDLLIGYLGTNQITVESLFDGAIVAPFTTMILRAVNGVHTGFFAAKDLQILDAHGQVQYRAPLSIIVASKPPGITCEQLLAAIVPPNELAADIARFCKSCTSSDDTDRDGVPDCVDACPYDPKKTQPGICGCGIGDTDSDCDGVPDCIDECPQDPNNTSVGECGCLGQANLKSAGTLCTDSACPQSGATCNGAGVCGNRAACQPAPNCRFMNWHETSYWVCGERFPLVGGGCADGGAADAGAGGQTTRTAAQLACSSKGLTLTRINSLGDNRRIDQFLSVPLWLGANDLSTPGAWRWASPAGNDGDQFWSGGPSGSPVNSRFSNWAQGAPGAQVCAAMLPFDGHWVDVGCNDSLGYACQYQTPYGILPDGGLVPPEPPPGMPHQPLPAGPCIPEQSVGLPNTIAQLQNEILAARARNFDGSAAHPPPDGSVCTIDNDPLANALGLQPDAGIGCAFVNVDPNSDCISDSDCSPGFVCRQQKRDNACNPPDGSTGTLNFNDSGCVGSAKCGQVICRPDRAPCDQIEVCNPGTSFDAGLDDGSTLVPRPFNPASLFDGGIPDAGPSASYSDPPGPGRGTQHPWCTMAPQDPKSVQNAAVPSGQYHGQSGSGSLIHFNFDPDLIFDVQANPIALGETQLHLHAKGALRASFALRGFLGQDFDGTILDASIGLAADRCSLNDTDDTKFQVFGLDFINPFDFGIPKFNTNDPSLTPDLSGLSQACTDSVGQFLIFADRAKKAFRDAQQLLQQYYAAQSLGKNLGDLCQTIGVVAATVPDFPGGNFCYGNESPEITINRFIDYYQLPGQGAITQLRDAMNGLGGATNALKKALQSLNVNAAFGQPDKEESQTILSAAFSIGPVPMVLQVDIFADYGVPGKLDINFDFPFSLDANALDNPMSVAGVKASVVPHASAGISAFVGAGFDFGALSVELGIEGAVNLADIKLPVSAGAELDEVVTQDLRPFEPGIGPPVSATGLTQFGVPTAFKFFVKYDYGIRLDITNILGGSINAKLHIDFFFFSRTWRKQIVHFNGFELHQDIISGGSDPSVSANPQGIGDPMKSSSGMPNVAGGQAPMGRAESPVPLMVLGYLPTLPDGGTDGSVGFDASNLQGFFYDDLCCSKLNEFCSPTLTPRCCPGFNCVINGLLATCQKNLCADFGAKCAQNSDCCSQRCDANGVCGVTCGAMGAACNASGDCCPGFTCNSSGACVPIACGQTGSVCTVAGDCCPGFTCSSSGACVLIACGGTGSPCTVAGDCCASLTCQSGSCTQHIQ